MKKIITIVAAMVLTFAVSTTAFAAPSVTNNATSGTTSGSGTSTSTSTSTSTGSVTYVRNFSAVAATATDANGNAIEVQVKQLTAAQVAAAQAAVTAQFGQNVDVLGAGDYSVAGASETNPVTLKFSVAVSAGDNVCILHQHHDGNWYVESATAGDGVVTATFTSFSPMAIIRIPAATVASSDNNNYSPEYYEAMKTGNGTSAGTTAVTSPKTGEGSAFGIAALAAVCACACVIVRRKKIA